MTHAGDANGLTEPYARRMARNFGLIGVGGFVAPRHLRAIADNGHRLLAACDPFDSVGVLDRYFPEAGFFTEIERFDRFLEKQRRRGEDQRIHWISVCSPNYLHDAHVRLALRVGAHALCEKPLVINPWNLDQLEALEQEYDGQVFTVLQLRLLESLRALREEVQASKGRHRVELTYITRRGRWYGVSWKGVEEKSGGLVMNIGIHFFDLLLWVFGPCSRVEVHRFESDRVAGFLELERADVSWFLSINADDLPQEVVEAQGYAYRSLSMNGAQIDFSTGFTDLHTELYRRTLAGEGFRIGDARPSIELAYRIRTGEVNSRSRTLHPLARG